MQKILIIDDDEGVCYSLARILAKEDCRVTAVQTPVAGFEALRGEDPDLVLLDIKIPGSDGLDLLRNIREQRPRQLVVMMTAHGTTDTAIEAMKRGAYDYLMKPFNLDALRSVIGNALANASLNKGVPAASETIFEIKPNSDRLVGKSEAMQHVYKKIGQVAPREVPVLIRGESGTGKELVARALWQHSKRADRPFLAVNCAAIPENLLEGELFGHEKGSFTGAESRKLGKFEQADKGTLFLDEVGDMSIATQAKILRVLQNNTFERVGGTETIKVDVRIVAATHQHLEKLIKNGKFREDLYYRLRVMEIMLPPLRERRVDIPEITKYLLARHREALSSSVTGVSTKAMEALMNYDWPGNIRQLENIIRRAMVLCSGSFINMDNLDFGRDSVMPGSSPLAIAAHSFGGAFDTRATHAPTASSPASRDDTDDLVERILASGKAGLIEHMERLLIGHALEKLNGNQLQTAKLLGITRNTLRNRIEKFGFRPKVKVI